MPVREGPPSSVLPVYAIGEDIRVTISGGRVVAATPGAAWTMGLNPGELRQACRARGLDGPRLMVSLKDGR